MENTDISTEEVESKPTPSLKPTNLGSDLPSTEKQLFDLDKFPLLDVKNAIEIIGSKHMLYEILPLVIQDIINDGKAIKIAYSEDDWENVEKIAHKIKSGALYSGTTRMKYACQYLGHYQQTKHTELLDKLYHQLIQVLQQTKQCIEQWLAEPSQRT